MNIPRHELHLNIKLLRFERCDEDAEIVLDRWLKSVNQGASARKRAHFGPTYLHPTVDHNQRPL